MALIENLKNVFSQLNSSNLDLLKNIYSEDMIFEDPAHSIYGLKNFLHYCKELYSNLSNCTFNFETTATIESTAFLEWKMYLSHPKLNKGNTVIVSGISKIIFEEKIIYHRDYFDLGQMLYEQLPYIGFVIKKIKRKLGQ